MIDLTQGSRDLEPATAMLPNGQVVDAQILEPPPQNFALGNGSFGARSQNGDGDSQISDDVGQYAGSVASATPSASRVLVKPSKDTVAGNLPLQTGRAARAVARRIKKGSTPKKPKYVWRFFKVEGGVARKKVYIGESPMMPGDEPYYDSDDDVG